MNSDGKNSHGRSGLRGNESEMTSSRQQLRPSSAESFWSSSKMSPGQSDDGELGDDDDVEEEEKDEEMSGEGGGSGSCWSNLFL